MAVTQDDIDDAVIYLKGATYTLAYELALESKYGGRPCCCWTRLKLLWMWTNTLSCQVSGDINSLSDDKIKLLLHKVKSICKKQ